MEKKIERIKTKIKLSKNCHKIVLQILFIFLFISILMLVFLMFCVTDSFFLRVVIFEQPFKITFVITFFFYLFIIQKQ